ncbi:MAG: FapA family protein [Treponema sp.]|nr:FapA family protein [Treponema sp.]
MIDFVKLQQLMKEQLELDRTIHSVESEGPTLDAALAEASTLLDLPLRHIEYEVIERGFNGILGAGKKDWKIKAYGKAAAQVTRTSTGGVGADGEIASVVAVNTDGEVFVRLTAEGVMLKVKPPAGSGRFAIEAMAVQALNDRFVKDVDKEIVRSVVKEAEGIYVKVGTFERNYSHDSSMRIEITDNDMKASIIVEPAGARGSDLSYDVITSFLRNNRVVYGIKKDVIERFVDYPVYKTPVLVAEGTKEVNGRNAYIEYKFETNPNKIRLRESRDGKVDFKDLQIIQNVVENQPVAVKIPAQEAIKGKTVKGDYLPAKDGVDIPLPIGKNVHADKDGRVILADINGQVMLAGGVINVEPVFVVEGNVCLKTGNIIFLGTVVITGNVEDGFSVKAAGNIEVKGTVERAELEAEGDVIVAQGITGKSTGHVKAGKSIWARFIENAIIDAGDMVVVSDGIINSQVDAYKRIVCQGKRARIVGGRLRASEEINAQIIGSSSGSTETVCEVGIDPKIKEAIDQLLLKKSSSEKELEDVQAELQALINIKAQRKNLPEDKEFLLNELMDQRNNLTSELQNIDKELNQKQEEQNAIKTRGRVSIANIIYAGTKIIVRDVVENIRNEYRSATFILEGNLIRAVKYEEPDKDAKREPEYVDD